MVYGINALSWNRTFPFLRAQQHFVIHTRRSQHHVANSGHGSTVRLSISIWSDSSPVFLCEDDWLVLPEPGRPTRNPRTAREEDKKN